MRVDKFLKISRLIKRRTMANEACEAGRVKINDKVAKPSTGVKVGDTLEIQFGNNPIRVEIKSLGNHVSKVEAREMYEIL